MNVIEIHDTWSDSEDKFADFGELLNEFDEADAYEVDECRLYKNEKGFTYLLATMISKRSKSFCSAAMPQVNLLTRTLCGLRGMDLEFLLGGIKNENC